MTPDTTVNDIFYTFNDLLLNAAQETTNMTERYGHMTEDSNDIDDLKNALVDDYQMNSAKLILCQYIIENQSIIKDMLNDTLDADEFDLSQIMTYEYENFEDSELENHEIYKKFDTRKKL